MSDQGEAASASPSAPSLLQLSLTSAVEEVEESAEVQSYRNSPRRLLGLNPVWQPPADAGKVYHTVDVWRRFAANRPYADHHRVFWRAIRQPGSPLLAALGREPTLVWYGWDDDVEYPATIRVHVDNFCSGEYVITAVALAPDKPIFTEIVGPWIDEEHLAARTHELDLVPQEGEVPHLHWAAYQDEHRIAMLVSQQPH